MKNFRNDIKINDLAQPFLEQIIEQMTTVFDPEIELDIYNLGLIYEINIDENGHCYFLMTFTDTGCGCEETMPYEIAEKLKAIDGINSVKVETTYSPVWKMTRISRYGRIAQVSHLRAENKTKTDWTFPIGFLLRRQCIDITNSHNTLKLRIIKITSHKYTM